MRTEMTEEQRRDAERLDRYIAREQLASVMNETKWLELRHLMLTQAPFRPRWRTKCLRNESPSGWDSDRYYHLPQPFKVIEWLEIDPMQSTRIGHLVPDQQVDHRDALLHLLASKSIPHEVANGYIKIRGYLRPTA